MKKKILMLALSILGVHGEAMCQGSFWWENPMSPTEATFSSMKQYVKHRHIVSLEKGAKIIFELGETDDYSAIKNLDSIVAAVEKNIAFYKDSLRDKEYNTLRIDYTADNSNRNAQMRFIVHPLTSDLYINQRGDLSRLKIERDTIRVRILRPFAIDSFWTRDPEYPIQMTILLNSYSDLKDLRSNYNLNTLVDTLAKLTVPKSKREKNGGVTTYTSVMIQYTTQNKVVAIQRFYGLYEKGWEFGTRPQKTINFHGNIGAGLVRNKIAPMGEVGIDFRWNMVKGTKHFGFIGVYAAPYFLFEKNADGTYHTYDNWFANVEMGEVSEQKSNPNNNSKMSMGLGYLINPNGMALKNATLKVFLNMRLGKTVTVCPEMIVTDNFKSFFPGITVKAF